MVESKIIWTYKPIGYTPKECIDKCYDELSKDEGGKKLKLTYAGRLDPMAYGLLPIILNGVDHIQVKEKLLNCYKTYQFKVILGLESDTYDILGMVKGRDMKFNIEKIQEIKTEIIKKLESIKKEKIQSYPPYSSKTIFSKHHQKKISLWQLATEGLLPDILPVNQVDIKELNLCQIKLKKKEEVYHSIKKRFKYLSKTFNFRNGIIESIDSAIDTKDIYCVLHLEARVSTGTYVRNIGNDLGGVTYDIFRTSCNEKSLDNPDKYDKFKFEFV